MGILGWCAAIVLILWVVERLRGSSARLADRPDARKVGGAIRGIASDLPLFGGQQPFVGETPPPAVLEPERGSHQIRIEPPTRPKGI